jgi:alpha-glucosidase
MTRWAGDDERRARVALLMLLTLRGTPFLYYGDEIALEHVPVDPEAALDPVARRTGDPSRNRDPCRTPMPWNGEPGAGFTADGDTRTWLPIGDNAARNVADQREDPASTLHLVRDLIGLRRERADLTSGAYETLDAPEGAWCFRRGEGTAVALNLGDAPAVVLEGVAGRVLIATDRSRDGEEVAGGSLELGPWQAAVVAVA